MARALKRPDIKLPAKLATRLPAALPRPKLPRLPDPNEPDVFEEMTLLEHMEELRDRIVKIVIAIGIAFVAGIFLAGPLLRIIVEAAQATGQSLNSNQGGLDIKSPTDPIAVYFKIALYIAIGIATPVIVWQFIGFLAPGLTRKEKRILFSSLPFVVLLFVVGAAYAFFIAAPRAFQFLSSFFPDVFQWNPDGPEVISFFLTLMVGLGLAFQMPVVMFLLAKLNVVSARRLLGWWRYALILILIASAVITPSTDPINMSFVAIPLLALYAIGIGIAFVFARPSKSATPPSAAA